MAATDQTADGDGAGIERMLTSVLPRRAFDPEDAEESTGPAELGGPHMQTHGIGGMVSGPGSTVRARPVTMQRRPARKTAAR